LVDVDLAPTRRAFVRRHSVRRRAGARFVVGNAARVVRHRGRADHLDRRHVLDQLHRLSLRSASRPRASTKDFRTFARHGIIFPPNNRDVTIFPEKIDGRYVALHRPMPEGIGEPAIWIASSLDLMAWGDHRFVARGRRGAWDGRRSAVAPCHSGCRQDGSRYITA
jgi:hypothetical protein